MVFHLKVPHTYNETLDFSVRELAAYLGRMLPGSLFTIDNEDGTPTAEGTFCISLYKEETDTAITSNDSYAIHIGPDGGSITGSNERSVLLGVYAYLHLLGCRFLAPGKQYEEIPVLKDSASLCQDEEKTASYRHRGVCIEGANSLENVLDFIDWLPKLGYNSFFLQFKQPYTFFARWYHHELNPLLEPEAFDQEDAARCTRTVEAAMKKRGILLHKAGHGWTGEVLGFSSTDWKTSSAPLDSSKLSLAAMRDGKRELFSGIPMNTNLCLSNPDAEKEFADQVVNYIEEQPDIDCLHVWLADEFNNICECEACRQTTLADQYIRLLNRIDQILTERELDTRIVFLLYQELLWPPKTERIQNPDRFLLMFAPISRTFEHSYMLKESYGPIPEYHRNHITLPVDLDQNMAFLRAWQDIFSGDSFVYDYPLGRAHYGDFGYVHISRVIHGDIKKLHQMGLNGYISCQELRAGFPNALPGYVMGRTLFDETLTFEDLKNEYMEAAYGPDCKRVDDYLSSLSELCSCDYFNGKGPRINPEFARRMERLMDLAANFDPAAGSTENLFWKVLDYHKEYSLRLGKALQLLAEGQTGKAQTCWEEFQKLVCENESGFQECLDVYRVTEVSSKYTGFKKTDLLAMTLDRK